MKVVICGGGTGGHLSVAKVFLEECARRQFECIFIGSKSGQDEQYFAHHPNLKAAYFLDTSGVVNKKGFQILSALFLQLKALRRALSLMREFGPCFVFCVGGYSAAPAALGAILLKIPLIIHEQNAKMGRLNSLLKPASKLFFSSYDAQSLVSYYPVHPLFFEYARVRDKIESILFVGGSQGARAINDFALSVASDLQKRKIRIYHQCGERDFARMREEYQKLGLRLKVFERMREEDLFEDDFEVGLFAFTEVMARVVSLSDFAIARSGASSVWEFCANGLVGLYIPYPHAFANHQYANAKFLEDANLAFLCQQRDLFDGVLWQTLELLESSRLECMSEGIQRKTSKEAIVLIVDCIMHHLFQDS